MPLEIVPPEDLKKNFDKIEWGKKRLAKSKKGVI